MANPKRASMREGPLAALFRKTEDDAPERGRRPTEPAPEPRRAARARAAPSRSPRAQPREARCRTPP